MTHEPRLSVAGRSRRRTIARTLLDAFKPALTAELLVLSDPVLKGASTWNARAHRQANEVPSPEGWPVLPPAVVYEALVSKIGLLEGPVATAVIAFYGSLLDLRVMSTEAMHGRTTLEVNNGEFARRFQVMANYLADALDGLNEERPFRHLFDTRSLVTPSGVRASSIEPLPTTLQALLRALGGWTPQADATRSA
jgi:hypothetical protein